MIEIKRHNPNDRVLELGGGANPVVHPTCLGGKDVNVDVRDCFRDDGSRTTDFTADFNEPLPITTDEFDQVICQYCLEHISWRKVKAFIGEMIRVVKPGGAVLVVTSNTQRQFEWILNHPEGWDGKDLFESASGVIFGDNDYPENTHRAYFSEKILETLFAQAGFTNVQVMAHGARDTDLVIVGTKPGGAVNTFSRLVDPEARKGEAAMVDEMKKAVVGFTGVTPGKLPSVASEGSVFTSSAFASGNITGLDKFALQESAKLPKPVLEEPRESLFDKHYFNGGGKVGGYAREGYRDFPVHELTARHVLMRGPRSVLEIGAARGYIGKRLQDARVVYTGVEISQHCWMTRVCNNVVHADVCDLPWKFLTDQQYDLSFSIATLEHIPERYVQPLLQELGKRCKRHLHAVDFGGSDDGFDKTHCTLKPPEWWRMQFMQAGITDYEVVNKEDFEKWFGPPPAEITQGDGKLKLNLGSFTTMFQHGWINVDQHNLGDFAAQNGYRFLQHDIRKPLPFKTGDAHLVFVSHFLEHLTRAEAAAVLKDIRRVLNPKEGAVRIVVPDAHYLMELYMRNPERFDYYKEINDEIEKLDTPLEKLYCLLHGGHQSVYDWPTLSSMLLEANLKPSLAHLRDTMVPAVQQILKETTEMGFELSLFVDATPGG